MTLSPSVRRVLLATLLVFTAYLLQVSILGPIGLPGAPPDLVLIVVAALALVFGPMGGSITGFGAGLLVDVLPPSDHLIGRYALVYCLAGYLVGMLREPARTSALASLLVVIAASVFSILAYAGIGVLLSDPRVTSQQLAGAVPLAVLYDAVVAAFLVPVVVALGRRTEPAPAY